jgi:hypothetical protein
MRVRHLAKAHARGDEAKRRERRRRAVRFTSIYLRLQRFVYDGGGEEGRVEEISFPTGLVFEVYYFLAFQLSASAPLGVFHLGIAQYPVCIIWIEAGEGLFWKFRRAVWVEWKTFAQNWAR